MPLFVASGAVLAAFVWRGELEAPSMRVVVPLLLALFFTALLVLALEHSLFRRALDNAPCRFVARYSYGLYVWHLILLAPIASRLPAIGIWPRAAVLTAVSLAAAIASYHLFEERFLRLKSLFPQRHL
jgi:peptidoglycan/LPS O-acetylase OafA/YrhL